MVNETISPQRSNKWHKNYTRLMPYYYVNKRANLKLNNNNEEKIVRVRKIIKNRNELIIEIAEKFQPNNSQNKSTRKKLKESSLQSSWDQIEEISYESITSKSWSLTFIR